MSVERLPSGGWRARWRDASGKERSKGSKRWRKRDAEAYERKMINLRDSGEFVTSDMTVDELADLWLASSHHLAEVTLRTHRTSLQRVREFMGHRKIRDITPADIDAYIAHLARLGRQASTQRMHLNSILSPMFAFARKRKLILVSPTADVQSPKVERKERRFLTFAELQHLASCFPERYQNLILFTGVMGPRSSEVWALRPSDVTGDTVLIRGTKSRASYRRLTMPRFVREIVDDQIERWSTPATLWPDESGERPNLSTWRDGVWYPCMKAANLGHFRFHDLRHTAAALAIATGAHPKVVQARMGHTTISITYDVYGHLFPGADEHVASELDKLNSKGDDDDSAS